MVTMMKSKPKLVNSYDDQLYEGRWEIGTFANGTPSERRAKYPRGNSMRMVGQWYRRHYQTSRASTRLPKIIQPSMCSNRAIYRAAS